LMNVRNLVEAGQVKQDADEAFSRLFGVLQLEQSQLEKLKENLRFALDTSPANQSSALAPLVPDKVEELVWLGLSPATVSALQPYITMIAAHTLINVNTASAEAIYASTPKLTMADAQKLVSVRERTPFRNMPDVVKVIGRDVTTDDLATLSVRTSYFEVRSRLRLDKVVVEERALIYRANADEITIVWRERGIVDPTALAQAVVRR
ncbi:MAG: general secretion pathway protein GspK, partial [Ramlibacter sp.]|nr:general secretion pathway protein GspK [Ramlibacter sp.]